MKIRYSLKLIERSGLKPLMERYTFAKYAEIEPWQKTIKAKADDFLKEQNGKWFCVLGQTGSGKTHICTAIASAYLEKGMPVYYMIWNADARSLKASVNDDEKYDIEISKLQTVDVLYIDDLFKCKFDALPTDADVRLAYEILNARYNAKITTLISSEFTIDALSELDAALAGRVKEAGGRYITNIAIDQKKDMRWKEQRYA